MIARCVCLILVLTSSYPITLRSQIMSSSTLARTSKVMSPNWAGSDIEDYCNQCMGEGTNGGCIRCQQRVHFNGFCAIVSTDGLALCYTCWTWVIRQKPEYRPIVYGNNSPGNSSLLEQLFSWLSSTLPTASSAVASTTVQVAGAVGSTGGVLTRTTVRSVAAAARGFVSLGRTNTRVGVQE